MSGESAPALVGVAVPVPLRRTFTYRLPAAPEDQLIRSAPRLAVFARPVH